MSAHPTQWTKPDFEEIKLGMEATAYVNTDDPLIKVDPDDGGLKSAPSL